MKLTANTMRSIGTTLILLGSTCMSLQAQTLFNYDFSTENQFTDNFTPTFGSGNVAWNAAGDVRLAGSAGGAGGIIVTDASSFLTETIGGSLTLDSTVGTGWSFGVFTRVTGTTGVLALINFENLDTSLRLRLFSGAATDGSSVGTVFYDNNATGLENPLDKSNFSFTLTQTDATNPVFNLSVSDAQGLVLSTGDRTLLSTAFNSPGSVGFRLFGPAGTHAGSQYLAINSVEAIPEPGIVALLIGAIAVIAVLRGKRQSSQRA